MTNFTSDIQIIPHNRQLVYDTLSNMENLAKVKERLPEDKFQDLIFDRDSCSFSVSMLGQLRIVVVDREAPETIRWAVEKAPVDANLLVQLIPVNENETRMQLTVEANLNPFLKPMLSKPLQEGINRVADILTVVPYDELQR
ncbi:polyketide cyclase [Bacteroidia bacterium]|nr:polyketide cyclase [Bacteroidia bacterium]